MQGTTSACAENTCELPSGSSVQWNYLRVRGEYSPAQYQVGYQAELPPRARRIRIYQPKCRIWPGTTSACAENTEPYQQQHHAPGNYLRVRGEYARPRMVRHVPTELPPRARRIPAELLRDYRIRGTTSACAENTLWPWPVPCGGWNYLRVRGEYRSAKTDTSGLMELPPRARRIRVAGRGSKRR